MPKAIVALPHHKPRQSLSTIKSNKSVFENYSRATTLNQQEMDTLLTANAGGKKWQEDLSGSYPGSNLRVWNIIDPTTKKVARTAVSNGGSDLSFYVGDIAIYCAETAKAIEEKSEKKRTDNVKGF